MFFRKPPYTVPDAPDKPYNFSWPSTLPPTDFRSRSAMENRAGMLRLMLANVDIYAKSYADVSAWTAELRDLKQRLGVSQHTNEGRNPREPQRQATATHAQLEARVALLEERLAELEAKLTKQKR